MTFSYVITIPCVFGRVGPCSPSCPVGRSKKIRVHFDIWHTSYMYQTCLHRDVRDVQHAEINATKNHLAFHHQLHQDEVDYAMPLPTENLSDKWVAASRSQFQWGCRSFDNSELPTLVPFKNWPKKKTLKMIKLNLFPENQITDPAKNLSPRTSFLPRSCQRRGRPKMRPRAIPEQIRGVTTKLNRVLHGMRDFKSRWHDLEIL